MEKLQTEPLPEKRAIIRYEGRAYVTAQWAADEMGVHYSTVLNLVKYHGRLDSVKIGYSLFITVESLDAEIARRRGEKN